MLTVCNNSKLNRHQKNSNITWNIIRDIFCIALKQVIQNQQENVEQGNEEDNTRMERKSHLSIYSSAYTNFQILSNNQKTRNKAIQIITHFRKTCFAEKGKNLIHGLNVVPKFEFQSTINKRLPSTQMDLVLEANTLSPKSIIPHGEVLNEKKPLLKFPQIHKFIRKSSNRAITIR